jgi:hypothetical protein
MVPPSLDDESNLGDHLPDADEYIAIKMTCKSSSHPIESGVAFVIKTQRSRSGSDHDWLKKCFDGAKKRMQRNFEVIG